jgi:transcriptional regulator with XRE-family HTH domain
MPASSAQIRAARGLVGWSQADLAEQSGLSRATINRAETGAASADALAAMQAALEKAGVLFLEENGDGAGVRLRKRRRGKQSIPVEDLTAENDE